MNELFDIAYAAATNRLCLFTGTGFSKAVTGGAAPGWQELLQSVCLCIPTGSTLSAELFPASGKNLLSLEEAAQVISIELRGAGKDIYVEIAKRIEAIKLATGNEVIEGFFSDDSLSLKVVTTNYDKLIEVLVGNSRCNSITPGLPIPRSSSPIEIYHVHGSIDSPKNMVVTSEDYFKFMNGGSYFSKKLSTVLHENTVVILGYSLGDTNLKAIISDYRGFSKDHVIGSNLFLISKDKVDQYIKDYYAQCFGIRVLDSLNIHEFFKRLTSILPEAKTRSKTTIENIRQVLDQKHTFKDDYLGMEISFFEILSSLGAIGRSINDEGVVTLIGLIIQKKIEFTEATGAWQQYEHLAQWLVHLGSTLELKDTSIESVVLDAVLRSMGSMSKGQKMGYSWHAYQYWKMGWPNVIASNRGLFRSHIKKNLKWADALELVTT